jgi:hypothetical protein
MRSIHPFPARMAPDLAEALIGQLPRKTVVLDPMAGSGVVLRHAVENGHSALGCDIDPLALLMARTWTSPGEGSGIADIALELASAAKNRRGHIGYPEWIARDIETCRFVELWFEERQRTELSRLVSELQRRREDFSDSRRRHP